MQKKAFIYDFDNIIFPVPSIGNRLFAPLFNLTQEDSGFGGDFESIKDAVMWQPSQGIAKNFSFTKQLTDKSVPVLNWLTYNGPLTFFEETRKMFGEKYLVTTGFYKLQKSKIDSSGVKIDFKEIYIYRSFNNGQSKEGYF